MTWNEWKIEVEKQMKEKGIRPEEAEIFYIDTDMPYLEGVEVSLEPRVGLVVTS